MYYIIYKITNLINGKIYIGAHQTDDLDDGYFGSGTYLQRAISKYGISNFRREIMDNFVDSTAMYHAEREIVNEEFVKRNDVYNLKLGGEGGWDYINENKLNGFSNVEVAKAARLATNKLLEQKYGPNWRLLAWDTKAASNKAAATRKKLGIVSVTDQMVSPEANDKRKKSFKEINHQQGEGNSNFGNHWITNGIDSKSAPKNDSLPIGWRKGRIIKKK